MIAVNHPASKSLASTVAPVEGAAERPPSVEQNIHLVGPFEIESALLEMAEVVESAAVGAPDPIRFEKVVVFVVLRAGATPSRELESRIRLHLANRVSSFASPQNVVFVEDIPKNSSGKIMRRLLRARFLGQDAGDVSTLDTP
jgi:acetyl-CoA synthetase